MIIPLLLFLMPFQQAEQQTKQPQQQLEEVQRRIADQQQQLNNVLSILEREGQRPIAVCSVELRRVNGAETRKVPPNAAALVPLNLFSTVSRPENGCLPAEVRITVSYMDNADNLVCSGSVENVAQQTSLAQSVNLEIRPWNFREFVRWRNEPPQTNSGAKRLVCMNPEGTAETTTEEFERVFSARVRATVFPSGGGMSTTEIQLNLR